MWAYGCLAKCNTVCYTHFTCTYLYINLCDTVKTESSVVYAYFLLFVLLFFFFAWQDFALKSWTIKEFFLTVDLVWNRQKVIFSFHHFRRLHNCCKSFRVQSAVQKRNNLRLKPHTHFTPFTVYKKKMT